MLMQKDEKPEEHGQKGFHLMNIKQKDNEAS